MNDNMRQQIMGASQAATVAPAANEDDRHDQNVDQAVAAALEMFYDENVHEDMMASIPEGDEMGGVALVASDLIAAIDDKSGESMPDDVIFPAALDIMTEIMDFMSEKGAYTFDDKEHARATLLLMQKLADEFGTTPEQMQEAMAELEQADKDEANRLYGDKGQ